MTARTLFELGVGEIKRERLIEACEGCPVD
jgi:hypothetical protein